MGLANVSGIMEVRAPRASLWVLSRLKNGKRRSYILFLQNEAEASGTGAREDVDRGAGTEERTLFSIFCMALAVLYSEGSTWSFAGQKG